MEEVEYIDWNDLIPIAKLGDNLILFILESDKDNPQALCVQVNFDTKKFQKAEPIQGYLKFNPYEQVDWRNPDVRYMYHDKIIRIFPKPLIIDMIKDFSEKYENR